MREAVFEHYDQDDSGEISSSELGVILSWLGIKDLLGELNGVHLRGTLKVHTGGGP